MKNTIFILVFATAIFLMANNTLAVEVSYNFNNEFQYFLYKDTYRDSLIDRMESSIRIGDLNFGFLMETREPLPKPSDAERKIGYLNLRKRYVILSKNDLSIRVGDFPVLFGRGLSINLFRDDNLPIDNEPEGAKLTYKGKYGNATIFSGNIKKYVAPLYSQDLTYEIDQTKNQIIRGVQLNGKPFRYLGFAKSLEGIDLGVQYVRFRGLEESAAEADGNLIESRRQLGGVNLSYENSLFDIYAEFVGGEKRKQLVDGDGIAIKTLTFSDQIQGFYGVINSYWSAFALSAEFKDYKNLNFIDALSKPYNNPPTVVTEHTSKLLGRHQYTLNVNNERGYKLQLSYTPSLDTEFLFNYTKAFDRLNKTDYFSEFFLEAEHNFENLSLHGLVVSHKNERGGDESGERTGGWLKSTYIFEGGETVSFNPELLITKAKEGQDEDLVEQAYTFTYSGSPKWTAIFGYEFTNVEEDNKKSWTSFEIQYNFMDNHFLRLFYGARRAGLNCAGGVCSVQPAFEGLELQIISSF